MKRTGRAQDNWTTTIREITFTRRQRPSRWDRVVDASAKAAALLRAMRVFPDDGKEHCGVLLLNSALRVIAWHKIGIGTVDGCIISPRDVFGPALRLLGVRGVIVAHNHPSGDPTPSQGDLDVSIDLARTGDIVDIEFHDHLVLATGNDTFQSISQFVKEHGGGAGKGKLA